MLGLLCFDLDGTLADTESLKAASYAWAARRLRPDGDLDGLEADYLASCVGLSRETISRHLLGRYGLEGPARAHDGTVEPWQSFVGLRLERYRAMLADGALVRRHAIGPAVALARRARGLARRVALVTTTDRRNADGVLAALGLADAFDALVTADDVAAVKPDPESYRLALSRMGVGAADALAIEDSPAGIRGALAAGVAVLAVPSAHTRGGVRGLVAAGALAADRVIAPEELDAAVRAYAAG